MADSDRATRRVIVVITLMALAAWALRGYVPGGEPAAEPTGPERDNPASLAAVVVLLTLAVAIVGFAIITRMRDRRPARPPAVPFTRGSGGSGRPTWRFTLIALAAVIAWLLLVVLLSRWDPGLVEPPTSEPAAPQETGTAAPEDDEPPPPSADDQVDGAESNVVEYLLPPMLVLLVLIVVGTVVASRHRQRPGAIGPVLDDGADAPTPPAAVPSLARAAEVGLAEIADPTREPRAAIIACYAAMERELTRVPGAAPQDFDTPSEVLARAVANRALRTDSATELVDLFEEARFSPHVMTEAHRDAAVRVLQRVLAEMPDRVPAGVA